MTPKELAAELQRPGFDVTEDNLTEWREKRLLPELKIEGRPGHALGKDYFWVEPDIIQNVPYWSKNCSMPAIQLMRHCWEILDKGIHR